MKWFARQVSVKWPKGVQTLPEVEQGVGGRLPVEFERDRAMRTFIFDRFWQRTVNLAPSHPYFGPMSRQGWLRWGYLHADHHVRQFGR